ncbi:hypothetical protein QTP70_031723, partial [Hemibagrus guttatus]
CSTCQRNILEGESLAFKLADRTLKDDDKFTIKKDDKLLVRKMTIKQKVEGWIIKSNDLDLQHVKLSDSGTYTVEVFDGKGANIKSYTETVCVYVKVPKPRVNVTCQDEKIYVTCEVEDSKDLSFSWSKNGKDIKEKEKVLIVKADKSKYTCTAKNPVHNNASDQVKAACNMSQDTLFGFDFTLMVGILAGGGGLVLALIILLVSLACRSCKRREKHQRDEEEFRLNYINTNHHPQKGKQTARGQPAPPEPVDYGSAEDLSQAPGEAASRPRTQQRGRPPPPPIDDDEEQPPPLPQPRKKAQVKKT